MTEAYDRGVTLPGDGQERIGKQDRGIPKAMPPVTPIRPHLLKFPFLKNSAISWKCLTNEPMLRRGDILYSNHSINTCNVFLINAINEKKISAHLTYFLKSFQSEAVWLPTDMEDCLCSRLISNAWTPFFTFFINLFVLGIYTGILYFGVSFCICKFWGQWAQMVPEPLSWGRTTVLCCLPGTEIERLKLFWPIETFSLEAAFSSTKHGMACCYKTRHIPSYQSWMR